MKKLFTYLLISSMVVLSSCTNYDDQFDDLNSQLSTLKTQIDGFTALSSGVTALQGTVSSLQAAVALLPKTATPATDISGLQTALTALAATVAELKTSLAGAATSAEVATLAANLATAQTDLSELLASNNVYSQDLIIDSASTLAFAESLGDKVSIINGSVVIYVTSTMDVAKVKAVANKIVTITGNLSYFAAANTIAAVSFDALTGTGDIEIAQAGSISFPVLTSAKAITLGNNYESKLTGTVDFGALETVTSIGTEAITYDSSGGSTAALVTVGSSNPNKVTLNKVTGVDLGSLTRYDANFTVNVKEGTLDLSSLTNANAVAGGLDTTFSLTASGVTILTAPLRTGGAIVASDVLEVSLPVWTGVTASSFAKATSVVLPKITGAVAIDLSTWAPKATKFHYIGTAKATSSTLSVYPSFETGAANSNLETLIVQGVSTSVDISNASSLTSVTLEGNANVVTFVNNDDMVNLTLDHASKVKTFNYGTLEITGNANLESVTLSELDDISSLDINTNPELTTITAASLNSLGTDAAGAALTAANISIKNNNLSASNIQLASEPGAVTTVAGKITTTSGLTALEAYILAAAALDTTPEVEIDNVASVIGADGLAKTSVALVTTGANKGFEWTGEDDDVTILSKTASGATTAPVSARYQTATAQLNPSVFASANSGSTVDGKDLTIAPNGSTLATATFDANGIVGKPISGFVATNPSTYAAALATELNAQLDAVSAPYDVTIDNDFGKFHTYDLASYTNGTAATISASLSFNFSIGGVAMTATSGASSEMAASIATAVAATGSPLSKSWAANAVLEKLTLKKLLVGGASQDFFSTTARPVLAFSGYSAALSLTHALGLSQSIVVDTQATSTGWRVTVKNESMTVKASGLEPAGTAGIVGTLGGTNVTEASVGGALSNTAVVTAWLNKRAGVTASAASTFSIVSWL